PGRKDRARVFEDKGMFSIVREKQFPADLIGADAHAGYYERGTFERRFESDIVEPARKRGYAHLIVVGVSLGGYGAVRYAMRHPGRVETLVLLSPFLGAGSSMAELADADDPDFARTWEWLRRYPGEPRARVAAGYPHIVLGYADEDLLLRSDDELKKLLPPADVVTIPIGAHEWNAWRKLLGVVLDKHLMDPATKAEAKPESKVETPVR
ncbi:MAG TPA: alpha/beta fold hydrolase, partial [Polyangia bacterium]|nr:alpha/beta fold hydrolase [Polyangia bacterium]